MEDRITAIFDNFCSENGIEYSNYVINTTQVGPVWRIIIQNILKRSYYVITIPSTLSSPTNFFDAFRLELARWATSIDPLYDRFMNQYALR